MVYRQKKELSIRYDEQLFQLSNSFESNSSKPSTSNRSVTTKTVMFDRRDDDGHLRREFFTCNRGANVFTHDGSIVCFCPPQYYGEKCQYHSDRLTFTFHLNFSQSSFAKTTDTTIVFKLLVLFLERDQIISSSVAHVRPALETRSYSKKIAHFTYSRSNQSLTNKRMRYFNRSSIIHDQPYSLRIEAYMIRAGYSLNLTAVWQYPIYFDYLPSFRFGKVLHLIELADDSDPCSSNPCHEQEECQPILNDLRNYLCLCRGDYRGENCSELDQTCSDGYCSPGSICKPTYGGLLNQHQQPYCICPANIFGSRCDLEYDQCSSNPCHNNGTCFPLSNPDRYFCLCAALYHGDECELRRSTVRLHLNRSLAHAGAVVQYFSIEYTFLALVLLHQQPYDVLPDSLFYQHGGRIAPEMVVVKRYMEEQLAIHVISVELRVTSINRTSEVSDENHCLHVTALFQTNEGSCTWFNSQEHEP